MAFSHLQPSFSGGEISPSLQARIDSPAYNTWLHTARNFYVHPQGGASNRPGTLFVGSAKYANKACRVIPFVLSEDEKYVLEVGHQYLRVYTPAGCVLDDEEEIYELESPYNEEDINRIQYTQYNQTLFLAHPSYPPYRLIRTAAGRFVLEELPIVGGPFQVANNDAAKQLRVQQYQETIETDGVRASVSFLPTIDSNAFVWAYFNNERFFYSHSYGFDVGAMVSAFNTSYGSSGFEAYNLGGVVKIESPQATGGNWNGVEILLEYRNSFSAPPLYTVRQTLSGGSNAGEIIVEGGDQFLLESNFDLFEPGHVGGIFSVTHTVENPYQSGTIGYDGTSNVLKTGSDFQLRLSGSWTGQIVLEKSTDMGVSWATYQTFSRVDGDDAINEEGTLEDTGGLYYLRLRGLNISGQAAYELNAAPFVQEGIVQVTDYISARQVQVSIEHPFGSDAWTEHWAEGSFGPKQGYPTCVFFYQDRLGLAGSKQEPQTLWFSKMGNYTNFGHSRGTVADDDSLSIHLAGQQLNAIQAVVSAQQLLVFTAGSEWSISCSGAFTLANLEVTQQGQRGARAVRPVMIGNRVLFVQASGETLRDFYYEYGCSSYTGEDVTLCAKHLFAGNSIEQMCYQQEPDHLIWCVLSNGKLASLTYLAEQEVCAWTQHDTQGYFRSICALPNHGYDELWLVVERENGWNIEKITRRLASKDPKEQVFLDAAVSFKSDDGFTTLTGLTHLEGQSVSILADGNVLAPQTVSSGTVTLPRTMYQACVGLSYVAYLQTLPVAAQAGQADKRHRVVNVVLQLVDSCGGAAGMEGKTLEEICWRIDDNFNSLLGLHSGYYPLTVCGAHERGAAVVVSQTLPLPFTLLALNVQVA